MQRVAFDSSAALRGFDSSPVATPPVIASREQRTAGTILRLADGGTTLRGLPRARGHAGERQRRPISFRNVRRATDRQLADRRQQAGNSL